jgi:AcrR family transcriptional regulator
MKMKKSDPRRRGRPLSFDRAVVLERAMMLFWRHGYESTSIGDLTEAMCINTPSLYAAFGDKKRLFLEAVDRYISGPVTFQQIIRSATTARDAARKLLFGAAVGFTGSNTPAGCLLASAAISCSPAARDVQLFIGRIRLQFEAELRAKIQFDIKSAKLPPSTAAGPLAAFSIAVIQGMSTLARDGAKRSKLITVAKSAMAAWPDEV